MKLLGLFIMSLPFWGLFGYIVSFSGWKTALLFFGTAILAFACVLFGAVLMG